MFADWAKSLSYRGTPFTRVGSGPTPKHETRAERPATSLFASKLMLRSNKLWRLAPGIFFPMSSLASLVLEPTLRVDYYKLPTGISS